MKKTLFSIITVSLIVLLTGCGIAVPDAKGKTVKQAEKIIESADFRVGKVVYEEKADGAYGAVIKQEPAAGESSEKGSLILLTVAGLPPVETPDLKNLDQGEAAAVLKACKLKLGRITESYDESITAGKVITQNPEAVKEIPENSAVDINISKGSQPIIIPNMKSKTQTEAAELLKSKGFVVEVKSMNNSASKGTVIAQTPDSGEAKPGSKIIISVSTGIEMVRVPNIAGKLDPEPILRKLGLKARGIAIHGPIEPDAAGFMEAYRQRPRAGTLVPKGTTVTYHYWWESQ